MATIFIDNRPHDVPDGVNLLHACLSLGLNLPYFCWHPAMGSVGACRQCAVKQFRDEKDTHGKLVMACMTAAAPGRASRLTMPDAREFRTSVAEWLMVHHPHDCPVCDEGGECHLQDMTVMNGHAYRRYRGTKRTFTNQELGPFVNQEMNRCIQCYRCVRFYRDYAGGRDFDAFFLRDRVFFGRHEDGTLESEFSGNLVEVCPTGVFTDKTLKLHFTRKWDERTAPSVCVHCGIGCNTIPGERYGRAAPDPHPVQRRGERLLPLRPRPLRLRVRQQRPTPPIAVRPRRPGRHDDPPHRGGARRLLPLGWHAHHRHRLAARVARSELRPARARRSRPLLFRNGRARARDGIGDPPRLTRRTGALGVAPRRRAVGRRPGARGGRDQHRADARPRAPPVGAPPAHGDRREAAHS